MSTSLIPATQPNDPCQLGDSGGYLGLENRLYRVEVHESGTINNAATFKWSRSNAAQVYAIDEFVNISATSSTIRLQSNGKDDILGLKVGDFGVEGGSDHNLWGNSIRCVFGHNLTYLFVKISVSSMTAMRSECD